jgi:hypothetical protein
VKILGFDVEPQTASAEDLATDLGRWYVDRFGVVPRLTVTVEDLDAAVAELVAAGVATTPIDVEVPEGEDEDVEPRGVRIVGPGGAIVDVVQPVPVGYYEDRIGGFIATATDLDGPPTQELPDRAVAIVAEAWDAIDRLLVGVAHNKVLATMLLVGQQQRAGDAIDSPGHWQRSAASSLLSGFVGRGAREAQDGDSS